MQYSCFILVSSYLGLKFLICTADKIPGTKPSQPGKPGLYEETLTLTPSCVMGLVCNSLFYLDKNRQKISLLLAILDAFLAFSEY